MGSQEMGVLTTLKIRSKFRRGEKIKEINKKALIMNLIASFLIALFLFSCAGRAANPVMVHQYGDDRKSCKALELELSQIEQEIQRLVPKTDKTGKNVALGVAGVFFLVPWLFMDLSQAEQIEVNAYRQRYNHLVIMATEKECGIERETIPDFTKKPETKSDEPVEGDE